MKTLCLDRYRAAIVAAFPHLTVETLDYLGDGWESVACLVNGRLVFRFPKRALVQHRLRKEIRLLPQLAPYLPLPIPQFAYIADPPGPSFPYLFAGYPLLEGMADEWPAAVWAAEWWRPALGRFLTALHAFPVARAAELGVTPMSLTGPNTGVLDVPQSWRATLEEFYELTRQKVFPLVSDVVRNRLTERFETFLAEERHFAFEPVLLHGDFAEDHVVVDIAAEQVRGIIDFGDVAIGDPALDVWPELLPHYGGRRDATFEERHQFYRSFFPLNAIVFGLAHEEPELVARGRELLEKG
jgi:aminoglycoside 2''-phosphotransferase